MCVCVCVCVCGGGGGGGLYLRRSIDKSCFTTLVGVNAVLYFTKMIILNIVRFCVFFFCAE